MRRSLFGRFLTALSILLLLGLGTALAGGNYVRWREGEDPGDAALQTAVATLRHPDPDRDVEVVLYGVVHLADADYYDEVQADLDGYDVVLYEGVAPGKGEPRVEDRGLGDMQKLMAEMLGLRFQKDGIDYTRSNLVHADMDLDRIRERLGGASLDPLGQVMDEEQARHLLPMLRMAGELGKALLQRSPGLQERFKWMMGQQLGNADIEAAMPEALTRVILTERNDVVMERLDEQLASMDRGRIAIFYGAAHHPDFEHRLREQGYRPVSKRWLTAWRLGAGVESARREPEPEAEAESEAAPAPSPAPATPSGSQRWY
ncbi:MAG: hypothetical protein HY722_01065 [Planctomycetes bacterium]|nr:hypothetical protein [Planctomycetota bacterium]